MYEHYHGGKWDQPEAYEMGAAFQQTLAGILPHKRADFIHEIYDEYLKDNRDVGFQKWGRIILLALADDFQRGCIESKELFPLWFTGQTDILESLYNDIPSVTYQLAEEQMLSPRHHKTQYGSTAVAFDQERLSHALYLPVSHVNLALISEKYTKNNIWTRFCHVFFD